MYALYVIVFLLCLPSKNHTHRTLSRPPDITVVYKVDRSPAEFLCTAAIWHKQVLQIPEWNSAFLPLGADFMVELTDTLFCELNKQEATLQNEGDIVTGPRLDACETPSWPVCCKMPRFVMDKILDSFFSFFLFFVFFGQLAYQVSWFFLPLFIFEEKWRAGRKILHSDESNSLWKFFF